MRVKNTEIYTNYYLLLEKCIKHFDDYQNLLKDNKICPSEKKLNNFIKQNNKTQKMNRKLLEDNKIM